MKKTLLFALTAILFTPSFALAVSDENVTKRRPDSPEQIQVQEIRQDRLEERLENREEVQTNLQDRRSNIAQNHANRLERRFKTYYTRLSNIMTRFQTRLDLLKKDGKDTTTAQTKLNASKTKLTEAKTKGDAAVAAFKAIDPAKVSEQKTELTTARDQAVAARKLFVEANDLLKLALKELKNLSKSALPAASAAVQSAQ
jgi:hypothetical protein